MQIFMDHDNFVKAKRAFIASSIILIFILTTEFLSEEMTILGLKFIVKKKALILGAYTMQAYFLINYALFCISEKMKWREKKAYFLSDKSKDITSDDPTPVSTIFNMPIEYLRYLLIDLVIPFAFSAAAHYELIRAMPFK